MPNVEKCILFDGRGLVLKKPPVRLRFFGAVKIGNIHFNIKSNGTFQ